jgi:hypothetical protein
MDNNDRSNLLIYRVREQGLEVFMVKDANGNDVLPQTNIKSKVLAAALPNSESIIQLDMTHTGEQNVAVEADWHEIPSLKSLLAQDMNFMKATIKQMLPDMMEQGTYFAVKEAVKKVIPEQYSALKELKDILLERNSSKF